MAGAIMILSIGSTSSNLMPVFVIIVMFGINGLATICYIITASMFPTLFSSTAFGICNMVSKIACIFSSQVAELHAPIPMSVVIGTTALSAIVVFFLYDKVENPMDNIFN